MKIKAVIFDFDGVLCRDLFYTNLKGSHPDVYEFIAEKVFGESGMSDAWMKGEMSYESINKFICDNTGMDFGKLSRLFLESVDAMKLDKDLINFVQKIKAEGCQTAIVTNNMDIFDKVIIAKNNLQDIFPVIVNSCNYGVLKHESNGQLFDVTLNRLGIENYEEVLLVDDSEKARKVFEHKGGNSYAYENFELFESWLRENLS